MTQLRTTVARARSASRVLLPYGRPYRRHLIEGALAAIVLVAARLAVAQVRIEREKRLAEIEALAGVDIETLGNSVTQAASLTVQ